MADHPFRLDPTASSDAEIATLGSPPRTVTSRPYRAGQSKWRRLPLAAALAVLGAPALGAFVMVHVQAVASTIIVVPTIITVAISSPSSAPARW